MRHSFTGVLSTMRSCAGQLLGNSLKSDVAQVQLNMRSFSTNTYSSTLDEDSLALTTGNSIARQMKWDGKIVDWFAYMAPPAELKSPNKKGVRILIANKASFGLSNKNVALESKVRQLVYGVGNGTVKFENTNNLVLDTIDACVDVKCISIDISAKAPSSGTRINIQYMLAYTPLILALCNAVKFW